MEVFTLVLVTVVIIICAVMIFGGWLMGDFDRIVRKSLDEMIKEFLAHRAWFREHHLTNKFGLDPDQLEDLKTRLKEESKWELKDPEKGFWVRTTAQSQEV